MLVLRPHSLPPGPPARPAKLRAPAGSDVELVCSWQAVGKRKHASALRGEPALEAESSAEGKTRQAKEALAGYCITPKPCANIRALTGPPPKPTNPKADSGVLP